VLSLPFTLEAFAFFAEAVFLGLYLYGWKRLSPRTHWWTGVPVAIAGSFSTLFIVNRECVDERADRRSGAERKR